MAGLLSRLAPRGYPGQIFVLKLRHNYGSQKIIDELGILDDWYSDLQGYLPEVYSKDDTKKEEFNRVFYPLLEAVLREIDVCYDLYDGVFEGSSCNMQEKVMRKAMRGVKYRLDTITAKAKILDGIQADDTQEMMAG